MMLSILIVIPSDPRSTKGNSITALRYKHLLESIGHRVEVSQAYQDQAADVCIAIHAVKSAEAIQRWKKLHPHKLLILILGGTDIYDPVHRENPLFETSLALADQLIVLQEKALKQIPLDFQKKAQVIHQSVEIDLVFQPTIPNQVCIVGHLRPLKNPFLPVEQIARTDLDLKMVHLGEALSQDMSDQARSWMKQETRYRWLGNQDHQKTLQIIQQSQLLIHPSRLEGGANVISESIMLGTPVIASRIDGNVGMLGEDYNGYFDLKKPETLVSVLQKALEDNNFYAHLLDQCNARKHLFSKEREMEALENVLAF